MKYGPGADDIGVVVLFTGGDNAISAGHYWAIVMPCSGGDLVSVPLGPKSNARPVPQVCTATCFSVLAERYLLEPMEAIHELVGRTHRDNLDLKLQRSPNPVTTRAHRPKKASGNRKRALKYEGVDALERQAHEEVNRGEDADTQTLADIIDSLLATVRQTKESSSEFENSAKRRKTEVKRLQEAVNTLKSDVSNLEVKLKNARTNLSNEKAKRKLNKPPKAAVVTTGVNMSEINSLLGTMLTGSAALATAIKGP